MTSRAPNALVHVNAVIEINEVGKIVNPRPFDWLSGAPTLANGLEVRAIGPDLRVAIHARLRRRNARVGELLDRRVTVAAIYSVIAYVMLVAELNRLFAREESLSVIRGSVELEKQPDDYRNEEDRAEDTNLGNEVRASMKDLAHCLLSSRTELENCCSRTHINFCASRFQFHRLSITEYLKSCPQAGSKSSEQFLKVCH